MYLCVTAVLFTLFCIIQYRCSALPPSLIAYEKQNDVHYCEFLYQSFLKGLSFFFIFHNILFKNSLSPCSLYSNRFIKTLLLY
uniref:Secreted protein n=1 Tax=Cebus imitator TaxID=2715852 RepID=A0A2K5P8W2_CEBIM